MFFLLNSPNSDKIKKRERKIVFNFQWNPFWGAFVAWYSVNSLNNNNSCYCVLLVVLCQSFLSGKYFVKTKHLFALRWTNLLRALVRGSAKESVSLAYNNVL